MVARRALRLSRLRGQPAWVVLEGDLRRTRTNMAETIFGKIIRGEVPAEKRYEDDEMIAIADIHPAAPLHLLIIPKKPIVSMADAQVEDAALLGRMLLRAAALAREEGVEVSGYRLLFNVNDDGGQTVPHLHLHLLGGRGMKWPPG